MPELTPPPLRSRISEKGICGRLWQTWFQDLRALLGGSPLPLVSYTVANAPAAASFTGHLIYVSDETGGATIAFSDGTNWRRVQDRVIIS